MAISRDLRVGAKLMTEWPLREIYPGSPVQHEAHVRERGYGSGTIRYASSELGTVELEICDECFCVTALCEHEKNSWNDDGTVLTCDLCGVDGT